MRGLAVALALIGLTFAATSLLQPAAKAQQGAGPGQGSLKICRAQNNGGRTVTWGCNSAQPCCFNEARNEGYCGPAGGRC